MTAPPQRFCEQCGASISPGSAYCEQCGAPGAAPAAQESSTKPLALGAEPARVGSRSGAALVAMVFIGVVAGLAIIWALASSGRLGGIGGGGSPTVSPAPLTPTAPAASIAGSPTLAAPTATRTSQPSPSPTPPANTVTPSATPLPTATPRVTPPPQLGSTVASNALTSAGIVQPASCPLQGNVGEFIDEGYRITVRGRCTQGSTFADLNVMTRALSVPDGEVSTQVRVLSGSERVFYYLGARVRTDGNGGYGAYFFPAEVGVGVRRWSAPDRPGASLGQETGAENVPFADGWNTVALRFKGGSMWVLLNDAPVLKLDDDAFDRGGIQFGVGRTGELSDTAPVVVVFRELRVRALVDGDPGRAPSYVLGS